MQSLFIAKNYHFKNFDLLLKDEFSNKEIYPVFVGYILYLRNQKLI